MIVPAFDIDEMASFSHDFDSVPNTFSGGAQPIGDAPKESLVTPRKIGFEREEAYIPVYWEDDSE